MVPDHKSDHYGTLALINQYFGTNMFHYQVQTIAP